MRNKKYVRKDSDEISIATVGSKCDSDDIWSSTENPTLQDVLHAFNFVNYSCVNSNTNIELSDIWKKMSYATKLNSIVERFIINNF